MPWCTVTLDGNQAFDVRFIVKGLAAPSDVAAGGKIAGLECSVALPLRGPGGRGMEPTEHGVCLIRHARTILNQLSDVRDDMRDISEGRVSRVSPGVMPAAAIVLMPRFITQLEATSVETAVSLMEGNMDALLPSLRAGDIDFIVGNLPPSQLGGEFASELLYEDPIVLVARRNHPLGGVKDLRWDMLNGYPMVLPPAWALTRGPIDDLLIRNEVSVPRRHVESISALTNVGVLQLTDSIGFLARSVAQHFEALGLLAEMPLELPNLKMRVGLVWRKERHQTTSHQLIRRVFHEIHDSMQVPIRETDSQAAVNGDWNML